MMKINKIVSLSIFLSLFASAVSSLTVSSFTCPQTYRTVQVGNTMDAVRYACGEPTTMKTQEVPVNTPIDISQWIYTAAVKNKDNVISVPVLVITIQNQQVTQIERTSFAAPVSTYCGNPGVINIGDNQSNVLAACGQPNVVNTKQKAQTSSKQVTQWIYNFGPYKPPAVFDFDSNGVLTQISSG